MCLMFLSKINEEYSVVYCIKCGTLNPDTATMCSNCESPLLVAENLLYSGYERRRYYEEQYGYRHQRNGVGLLIAGLFVFILGIATLLGSIGLFFQYFWPAVLILIGLWILFWGFKAQPPIQSTATKITYSSIINSTSLTAHSCSSTHKRVILNRIAR